MHEFLDGELELDLRTAMVRHLESCPDCAVTFAQLRQIEIAHKQLDAQIQPPPEEYWHALPQRVMERVKASERRHLLALPKLPLPRFKSSAERAPAAEKLPASDLLYLPSGVRKFLSGPAKYALPLAAVAAFCFFMIRELRQKPEATVMTESAVQQSPTELQTMPGAVGEKPTPSVAEVPIQKDRADLKKEEPAPSAKIAQRKTESEGKSILATSGQVAAGQGGELAGVMDSATSEKAKDQSADIIVGQAAVPANIAKVQESYTRSETLTKESQTNDDKRESLRTLTLPVPSAERQVTGVALGQRAATYPDESNYYKTLQQAQQTSNLQQREKIWRDFLATKPDSAYRVLAIFHLAQTLAAASDSSTTLEQLEKNLAFFHDHAATIRPLMGAKEFDRELARLQALVNHRKASFKP